MIFRLVYKIAGFFFFVGTYFLSGGLILLYHRGSFQTARPHLIKVISWHCNIAVWLFGIKRKVIDHSNKALEKDNYLICSNHLSYIDILVFASLFPSCFVTSKEVKRTPFLGQLCLFGGCLFVDRKNKSNLGNEVIELTQALQKGINITVFPEATSTNGEQILRFRKPLFRAALNAKKNVLPLCLNYTYANQKKLTKENRDLICWYDEMTFVDHFLKFLKLKSITVEVNFMKVLEISKFSEPLEVAQKTEEVVRGIHKPFI